MSLPRYPLSQWYWRAQDGEFILATPDTIVGDYSHVTGIDIRPHLIAFRIDTLIAAHPEAKLEDGSGYAFEFDGMPEHLHAKVFLLMRNVLPDDTQGVQWGGDLGYSFDPAGGAS